MNILVIGGAGYVGSRLIPMLSDHRVIVADTFWFWSSPEEWYSNFGVDHIKCDIRDDFIEWYIMQADLVINLACLSNDPSSDIDYKFTHDVSYNGVMNVIRWCNHHNKRLIQISSTSVYGIKHGSLVTEEDRPEPITQYSEIKREIDNFLLFDIKNGEQHTILRPATLYGYSPRLRLDVMINTLLDRAFKENKLMIHGGDQFRPCLHVDDLCKAIIASIDNQRAKGSLYNVTNENYSVNQIAQIIQDLIPGLEVHYQSVLDQRSYRVSSAKIKKELGLKFSKRVKTSIRELYRQISSHKNRDNCLNINVIKRIMHDNVRK